MQTGDGQFFLLLPEIDEFNIDTVISRVNNAWQETKYSGVIEISSEYKRIQTNEKKYENDRADWVAVVDDDMTNLQIAGHTLSANGMRVSALKSGESLLNFLSDNHPDLILLDVRMPGMDGFETMQNMKKAGGEISHIPVIFLTADDDEETEKKGLTLGAMDFIKKPIMPEVLSLRVQHTIELVRLQNHLAQEVDKKTEENEKIFIHVVKALAEAIDAKDTYTNGHSSRVAEYSRAIAKNAGYSDREQNEIYMMGLLHDVGKIGVPDEVINKPGKLSDDEFDLIKQHPVTGGRILKSIRERPKLATGARWHHERFGGGGYPDGLMGEAIPE
ncbi:MAG: response regulator, partial [Eubacterium sp.]|nr:response regulator [Eubacterium sp.]